MSDAGNSGDETGTSASAPAETGTDADAPPEGGSDADAPAKAADDPLADVPEWEDAYVNEVAGRLVHNYDLERNRTVEGESFDLYGQMELHSQKHILHPSISFAHHESHEHLFMRRVDGVSVAEIDRLVELGHDLADDWVEADEEHYSTDFTFVLVAPDVPENVADRIGAVDERTLDVRVRSAGRCRRRRRRGGADPLGTDRARGAGAARPDLPAAADLGARRQTSSPRLTFSVFAHLLLLGEASEKCRPVESTRDALSRSVVTRWIGFPTVRRNGFAATDAPHLLDVVVAHPDEADREADERQPDD